jgi:hypothetical protein
VNKTLSVPTLRLRRIIAGAAESAPAPPPSIFFGMAIAAGFCNSIGADGPGCRHVGECRRSLVRPAQFDLQSSRSLQENLPLHGLVPIAC